MQSSFIICLERDSDSKVEIGMVRIAWFLLRCKKFCYRRVAPCSICIIREQPSRGVLNKRSSENMENFVTFFATLLKSHFSMSVLL